MGPDPGIRTDTGSATLVPTRIQQSLPPGGALPHPHGPEALPVSPLSVRLYQEGQCQEPYQKNPQVHGRTDIRAGKVESGL